MNMSVDQLAGYIRNQAKVCGAIKAFITTSNLKVFLKARELKHNGYLTDCIAYNIVDDVIKLLAKDDTDITQDIFEKRKQKLRITDKENSYVSDKLDLRAMYKQLAEQSNEMNGEFILEEADKNDIKGEIKNG